MGPICQRCHEEVSFFEADVIAPHFCNRCAIAVESERDALSVQNDALRDALERINRLPRAGNVERCNEIISEAVNISCRAIGLANDGSRAAKIAQALRDLQKAAEGWLKGDGGVVIEYALAELRKAEGRNDAR